MIANTEIRLKNITWRKVEVVRSLIKGDMIL